MPRALITGGSGFVGQWMSRALLERGWAVFAGSITGAPAPGIMSREQVAAVRWLAMDVTQDAQVRDALAASDPEWILHLAGVAFPPEANADPVRTFDANALGALRLLAAVAEGGSTAGRRRVLVVGTSEQYGAHPAAENPLSEAAAQLPLGAYGTAKATQELIAMQYVRMAQLPIICTRSFNHAGVGQGEAYLLPSLVRRARELPARGGVLRIGNGTPVRDFLHVADVVRAYMLLLERGVPGEVYNVCSGRGMCIADLARLVLKVAGVTAEISNDPELMRPVDTAILVGDNARLRAATGWAPQCSIEDIIRDLLNAPTH